MGAVIRVIAVCWLVFILSFCSGVYVYVAKKWPYPVIQSIEKFIAGDEEEDTRLIDKIENDLGIVPARYLIQSQKALSIPETYKELDDLPFKMRRTRKPRIFFSPDAPRGYRLIYGVFDFKKTFHGAILFDPDGNLKNIWYISQEGIEWDHRPDANIFPHGFEIARDGSIVTAYDGGTSLTKYDYCGNILWRDKGRFHHSIAFDDDAAIWVWGNTDLGKQGGDNLIKLDYETGKVIKEFYLGKVVKANPDIDIFNILQEDSVKGSKYLVVPGDKWHSNDIDPLPQALAPYYPDFTAGDLLLSFRSLDLVCVIDPDNYKVKWWRQGMARRQHDPDWNEAGTITMLDNNMHRGYSSIVEINPVTYASKRIIKGEKYNFYTWNRGKHQKLPNGGYLITSTQQGRVFEVDKKGKITFEFINIYDKNGRVMNVSEALFLPEDYFKELPECKN